MIWESLKRHFPECNTANQRAYCVKKLWCFFSQWASDEVTKYGQRSFFTFNISTLCDSFCSPYYLHILLIYFYKFYFLNVLFWLLSCLPFGKLWWKILFYTFQLPFHLNFCFVFVSPLMLLTFQYLRVLSISVIFIYPSRCFFSMTATLCSEVSPWWAPQSEPCSNTTPTHLEKEHGKM